MQKLARRVSLGLGLSTYTPALLVSVIPEVSWEIGMVIQQVSQTNTNRRKRILPNRAVTPERRRAPAVKGPLPSTFDDIVAGFAEQVAIVDEDWTIIAVNDAWKQMVRVAGYPELMPGTNYRGFLQAFAERGHENAIAVLAGVESIDDGETDAFQFSYGGVDEWAGQALQLRIHRLRIQGHTFATIARYDVTDAAEANRIREDCTAAILNSETEARQRLTRELHDSTAQLLTCIGLLLSTLKHETATTGKPLIDEIEGLLHQATHEIRSMSYLAQAPDVAEVGIVQALDALASGFGRRAELDISFEVVGARSRVPLATKTVMYRVAQEALSNVYRHAGAKNAKMYLVFRKHAVHLIIADDGIGISSETLAGQGKAGVGIRGMRTRLAEIRGRLSVRRLRTGTAIVASMRLATI